MKSLPMTWCAFLPLGELSRGAEQQPHARPRRTSALCSCISLEAEPRDKRDWKGHGHLGRRGRQEAVPSSLGTILGLLVKFEAASNSHLILGARMGFRQSANKPWWECVGAQGGAGPPWRYRGAFPPKRGIAWKWGQPLLWVSGIVPRLNKHCSPETSVLGAGARGAWAMVSPQPQRGRCQPSHLSASPDSPLWAQPAPFLTVEEACACPALTRAAPPTPWGKGCHTVGAGTAPITSQHPFLLTAPVAQTLVPPLSKG